MKKFLLIILSIFLLFGLFGCTSRIQGNNVQTKELDVREVVWNQLTLKDKEQIEGTWKDSKLSKIVLGENLIMLNQDKQIINAKSFLGKDIYTVDFATKQVGKPDNLVVYASIEDNKIIGYGIAD